MNPTPQDPQALGRKLREAREALGLEVGDIAATIHVRPEYLQALEEGRWEDLPSPAQARGFLRLYAEALGLKPEDLGAAEQAAEEAQPAGPPPASPVSPEAWRPRLNPEARERLHRLGVRLQARRETLGLDYQTIAREYHIAPRYQQALEAGRPEAFTGPAQMRGMLTLYAQALGLEPEPLLEELNAALPDRDATWSRRVARVLAGWRAVLVAALVYGLVGVGVTVVLAWGGYMFWRTQRLARTPTPTLPPVNTLPPPQATVPLPESGSPQPTPSPAEFEATPSPPAETEPTQEVAPIVVVLEARARVWVRVLEDGTLRFQGRLAPGERRVFRAETRLEVMTANAGALRVTYNQQPLGLLGDEDQIGFWIFTPEELLTPTPTPTPTPTITPTPQATPTPTPTPTATPTPAAR